MVQTTHSETIFAEAIEIASPQARAIFLDQACLENPALRQKVEKLVADHFRAGEFLEKPVAQISAPTIDQPAERPGMQIGPYKLLQQIGEGGMGVVYMAEQTEPIARRVALKIIKPGMDTRQVIARFEAERQALALMDHVNIARVLDAGTTPAGRPYFVMELVHGVPITQYCDDNRLTPRQRLELFVPVCQAIQHAHQKGIIHRDIKPSNVMVTLYDGQPVPKVIDFGVAKATEQKLTEQTLFTQYGTLVGTLEYMSPEQAEMSALGVDTRSDIFSLGVLLYELLTGSTPLSSKRMKEAAYGEILRLIKEEEPPKPSTRLSDSGEALASISAQRHTEPAKLSKLVRGELDWIVMKCLEKDRARRYETANGFAADVQRYLDDEPVQACPPSAGYRFRKFARRNKAALATALVVVSTLCIATIGLTISNLLVRAERNEKIAALHEKGRALGDKEAALTKAQANYVEAKRQEGRAATSAKKAKQQQGIAEEQELLARRRLYAAHINLAHQAWEAGNPASALELLEGQRPKFDQQDLRSFEWYYLWRLCHRSHRLTLAGHTGEVNSVAFSPDGKTLASGSADSTVKIWDAATGQLIATLLGHQGRAWCVAFSPDGKTFASGDGKTLASGGGGYSVRLWDVKTWTETSVFKGGSEPIRSLAFSPDGKTLAAGTATKVGDKVMGFVKLWDPVTGEAKATLQGHEQMVMSVAFSPDSQKLASASAWNNPLVKLWDLTTEPPRVEHEWKGAWSVAFSPDGKTLAATMPAGAEGKVKLRDVATGKEIAVYEPLASQIRSVAFAPDGKTLAMRCADRTALLWEPATGRRWTLSHRQLVTDVAFSPDGQTVATASQDRTVKVWSVGQVQDELTLQGHQGSKSCIAYSPDGKIFAYSGMGDVIRLCDPVTGQERSQLHGQGSHLTGMAFSRDSQRLASGGGGGPIKLWDVASLRELASFPSSPKGVHALALSPDGKTLVSAGEDGEVKMWDLDTQQLRTTFKPTPGWAVGAVTYSPDGKSLVTADLGGWVNFWNTGTMQRTLRFNRSGAGWVWALSYSPDGKTIVTGGDGGVMQGWDAITGRLLATFRGHTAGIVAVAFFPDGKTLASGSDDGTVKLWDVPTGQERLTLLGHSNHVTSIAVAPNGKTLATGSRDGTVKLWRAADDREASALNPDLDPNDPASPVALIQLANTLLRIPRQEEAEDAFRRAISRLEDLQAAVQTDVREYSQLRAETQHQLAKLLIAGKRVNEAEPILVQAIRGYEQIIATSHEFGGATNNLGLCHTRLAALLASTNRPQEATAAYRKVLEITPDNPSANNNLAWLLATCRETKVRDPKRAIELAEKAVELEPKQGMWRNTLGVAQYRAGDWQAGIESLTKSMELRMGGDSFDWFFLAMAHWQLDNKQEARKWFDQAATWMDKSQPQNEELKLFRAEAAELLGVKAAPAP